MAKRIPPPLQSQISKLFDLDHCTIVKTETKRTDKKAIQKGEGKVFTHSVLKCDGGEVDMDSFTRYGKRHVGLVHNDQEKELMWKDGKLKVA